MRLQPEPRRIRPAAAAWGCLALVLFLLSPGGELRARPVSGFAAEGDRFPVVETTIADVHRAIREGRLTVRALVQTYLDRIAAYDQPTGLNALVIVNPKALETADALDAEFRKTGRLRPLHGVPVIVKDNFDTFDLPTSAGSLALADSIPPDDATVVKKLRQAGAVVLAKSNMAEWAFSPYLTDSSLAGVTRNPYDLERVPAGSSGGTAAAVAASLGLVGLGTDTGNSIRGPSAHAALVGLRPTMGLVSRDGIVPLYLRNDMGGPMTRTVEDAARVLSAIAGVDPADPVTAAAAGRVERDYTRFLDRDGLKKTRIGVFRTYADAPRGDAAVKALFEKALADMRAAGAEIIDPFAVPGFAELTKDLWCDMFRADVDAYLASRGPGAPFRSLADIVASGLFLPSVERRMRQAMAADPAANAGCLDLYRDPRSIKLRQAVLAAMDAARIDAFVYPTWSNVPRRIGDLESPAGDNSQVIPPHTGLPGISVPMGFSEGRWPAGLQIVGRLFGDGSLLKIAYAYEQAARHRRPPAGFPELGAGPAAETSPASPFAFEVQTTPVEGTIRALKAVSAATAWASGSRGSILRTVDGGKTWEARPVPGAEKLDFRSLAAFDAERAVVANAGSPGFIYKTTDGGKTWKAVLRDERPAFFIDALAFFDDKRGLALGDPIDGSFLFLITEDGGETWTPAPADALPTPLAGEAFFAASNGSLVTTPGGRAWIGSGGGPQARLFTSRDKGRTFTAEIVPLAAGKPTRGVFGLAFRSPRYGLAVGGDYQETSFREGIAARGAAGGAGWSPFGAEGPSGFRESAAFVPGRPFVLAVGPDGSDFSADGGANWSPESLLGCHVVAFAPDGRTGWAAGNKGRIVLCRVVR